MACFKAGVCTAASPKAVVVFSSDAESLEEVPEAAAVWLLVVAEVVAVLSVEPELVLVAMVDKLPALVPPLSVISTHLCSRDSSLQE